MCMYCAVYIHLYTSKKALWLQIKKQPLFISQQGKFLTRQLCKDDFTPAYTIHAEQALVF